MRLGRRLSAGIAEDPPAPATPPTEATVEATVEAATGFAPATPEHEPLRSEHREPAAQLADR
jgi:hypothetical protein